MIVLVRMKDNSVKKVHIRNHIFQEVDDTNKKKAALQTANIKTVFWPGKKMEEIPVDKWLKTAEENDFYNL